MDCWMVVSLGSRLQPAFSLLALAAALYGKTIDRGALGARPADAWLAQGRCAGR